MNSSAIPRRERYARVPVEVRRIIVYQAEVLARTSGQISLELDLPVRTVQRVLQRWRVLGDLIAHPSKEGPPRILSELHIQFILGLLEHSPDLYLDEIVEELWYRHGIEIGLSTLHVNLKELGITTKFLSKRAAEQIEEKRFLYIMQAGPETRERFVFVDETALNILNTFRTKGRAPKGQRAYKVTNFVRGERFSILPALSLSGILWTSIVTGSFCGATFLDFIDMVLEQMNPWPACNSVLVMDNCRIHHVEGVKARCDARGVKLIYLPPYSPDYNPIEEMFSAFKAYIRRHGSRFRYIVKTQTVHHVVQFIHEALAAVAKEESIRGWFRRYSD